jgi:hypothetical protein
MMRTMILIAALAAASLSAACDGHGPGGYNSNNCYDDLRESDSRPKCQPVPPLTCHGNTEEDRVRDCGGANEFLATCEDLDGDGTGVCRGIPYARCKTSADCASGSACLGYKSGTLGLCREVQSMPPPDMGGTTDPTCTDRNDCKLGDACPANDDCAAGLLCQGMICVADLGGACPGGTNNQCKSGLTCGTTKTCQASLNAACTANAQCLSGNCDRMLCKAILNQTCNASSDCDPDLGLVCNDQKKCAVPMLPFCTPSDPSGCGGSEVTCTPNLTKCGRGKKARLSADCAAGFTFYGTGPSNAWCGDDTDTVFVVTTKNAGCDKMHLVAKAGAGGANEDRDIVKDQYEFAQGIQNAWGTNAGGIAAASGACEGQSWNKPNGNQPAFWQFSTGLWGFSLTPK